jgi:ATP-dependent exoDNAse (exonuclease V) beta subunit
VTSLAKGLEYYHRKGIELDERMLRYKRLRIFLDQTDLEAETARLLAPKTPKG